MGPPFGSPNLWRALCCIGFEPQLVWASQKHRVQVLEYDGISSDPKSHCRYSVRDLVPLYLGAWARWKVRVLMRASKELKLSYNN